MFVDFVIGHGDGAEWIGSIELDSSSIPQPIFDVTSELEFRRAIQCFFQECEQMHTAPPKERSVPWTDYIYAFVDGEVCGSKG